MNPEDLINECITAINKANIGKYPPRIFGKIKHAKYPREYCYPLGKGTPKAHIVSWEHEDGLDVVRYDAVELLAFLLAAGDYTIRYHEDGHISFEAKEKENES